MIGFCVFFCLTLVALTCTLCFFWVDGKGDSMDDYSGYGLVWNIAFITLLCITVILGTEAHSASKADTCIEKHLVTVDFADGPSRSESVWTCTMHKPETKETK